MSNDIPEIDLAPIVEQRVGDIERRNAGAGLELAQDATLVSRDDVSYAACQIPGLHDPRVGLACRFSARILAQEGQQLVSQIDCSGEQPSVHKKDR